MKRLFFLLVVGMLTASVGAQELPGPLVEQAAEAYRQGDYQKAIHSLSGTPDLLGVVPVLDGASARIRARIFFDLGRCYLAAGDRAMARVVLKHVFSLHPNLRGGVLPLPPDSALERTRDYLKYLSHLGRQTELEATSRWKAAGRSLILPGWGQVYRGHKKRGKILMGATALLASVWFVADRAYRNAEETYRSTMLEDLKLSERTGSEKDPRPFESHFKKLESRTRTANIAAGALAAVWGLGIADGFWVGPGQLGVKVPLK